MPRRLSKRRRRCGDERNAEGMGQVAAGSTRRNEPSAERQPPIFLSDVRATRPRRVMSRWPSAPNVATQRPRRGRQAAWSRARSPNSGPRKHSKGSSGPRRHGDGATGRPRRQMIRRSRRCGHNRGQPAQERRPPRSRSMMWRKDRRVAKQTGIREEPVNRTDARLPRRPGWPRCRPQDSLRQMGRGEFAAGPRCNLPSRTHAAAVGAHARARVGDAQAEVDAEHERVL